MTNIGDIHSRFGASWHFQHGFVAPTFVLLSTHFRRFLVPYVSNQRAAHHRMSCEYKHWNPNCIDFVGKQIDTFVDAKHCANCDSAIHWTQRNYHRQIVDNKHVHQFDDHIKHRNYRWHRQCFQILSDVCFQQFHSGGASWSANKFAQVGWRQSSAIQCQQGSFRDFVDPICVGRGF